MTRRGRAAPLVVLALLLTGCGPEHEVSVGVRDVATDVLLSKAHATPGPSARPLPPAPPGFPFVPTPTPPDGGEPVPLPTTTAEPEVAPPPGCPTASPLVSAAHRAGNRPERPPAVRSYPVRVDGDYTVTGAHPAKGAYAPTGLRSIHDVAMLENDAGWVFQVSDGAGLTTSYQVIPQQLGQGEQPVESSNQSLPTQAGIYVTSFSYKRADGSTVTLSPGPAVMVAKLPFAAADRWSSSGVDPSSGIRVTVNGQTGLGKKAEFAKARVDACGTVLDAWWVEYTVDLTPAAPATQGREPPSEISGPDIGIQFVGSRLAFAPQYGGFPVEELYTLKGTDNGSTVTIRRHAVFSTEPTLVSKDVQ